MYFLHIKIYQKIFRPEYGINLAFQISVCVRLEILQLLLENGADINSRGKWAKYYPEPLHLACKTKNNLENIKFLLEYGADI